MSVALLDERRESQRVSIERLDMKKDLPLVLVVHQSAELYGSDRVLLLMVQEFVSRQLLTPVVVLPEDGPLVTALSSLSVEVHVADVGKVSRSMYTLSGMLRVPGRLWRGVRALDAIVAGRTVSAVHSNTLAVLLGGLWARTRRVHHVWHLHEILISPKWVGIGLLTIVRMTADVVICNSRKTHEWLLGVYPSMASRSCVVFNGLPDQEPVDGSEVKAFRGRLNAQPHHIVVTLLGRISRIKGQTVLIEAAALLKRSYPALPLKFAIVGGCAPGQEALLHQLVQRVHELALSDEVCFLPFVPDVGGVWQGSDIAVVPSVEPESFGMVAIEAMRAAKPVIASRQGGLLDVVVDGETGLLVPPGDTKALADAICELVGDSARRYRMGQAGLQRQRSVFTLRNQADAIANAYQPHA